MRSLLSSSPSSWRFPRRLIGRLHEYSKHVHDAVVVIHIIVHAKLVNPQAILAPERLRHGFDAALAHELGLVGQMDFGTTTYALGARKWEVYSARPDVSRLPESGWPVPLLRSEINVFVDAADEVHVTGGLQ